MTSDDFRAHIADLSVWSRGEERAPHKPLLLLWALGRLSRGEPRMAPYAAVDRELKPILREFGPPRNQYHTEYPFWYLRNDGLWEVTGIDAARVREGSADQPTRRELVVTVRDGGDVEVSPLVNGGEATDRWLVEFDGREIRAPRKSEDAPSAEYLAWHRREVYRAG